MTAPYDHNGPCRWNRRSPYAHAYVRGICHRCGHRADDSVDITPWRELEAAQAEFRKAAEAFDQGLGWHGMDAEKNLRPMIEFRNRLEALRQAEKAFGVPGA